MLTRLVNKAEWTFTHAKNNVTHQEHTKLQHWPTFYKITESSTRAQNYTTEENTLQLFELKCINNLLPVLVTLNKRNPDVYHSTTCIVCKEKNETVEHLVSCKVSINLLRDLEECAVKSSLWKSENTEEMERKIEEVLVSLGKDSTEDELRRKEHWKKTW